MIRLNICTQAPQSELMRNGCIRLETQDFNTFVLTLIGRDLAIPLD